MKIFYKKLRLLIEKLFVSEAEKKQFLIIFGGHIFFQTVYAALKLDVFTLLADHKKMTLEEIASALNIEHKPARILMMGLVTIDIVKKKGQYYYNSRIASARLNRKSPRNLIRYFDMQHHIYYRGIPHYYESIKQNKNVGVEAFGGADGRGNTLYERLAYEEDVQQIFQDAMHEISVTANEDLVDYINLTDRKLIVDIGGGDGTNLIQLCNHFPNLRGVVFDLPITGNITEPNIKAHQLSERIEFVGGDCFKDPLPKGADTFLLSHFCTIWSPEDNQRLYRNIYDALPKGGQIIIFNQMMNNNEDGPVVAAIGSPYFLTIATGEGMLYTWKEYQEWLKMAGFKNVTTKKLPTWHGVMIGEK